MIGWLSGLIVDKSEPGRFLINVNGVGYDLDVSMSTFFKLEAEKGNIDIYVHTVVREDAFLLYGFADKKERQLFRELIKVNGVGPKLAITILSSISPDEFIQCINAKDSARLVKLPGIGKKTAERLTVEMKDKLNQISPDFDASRGSSSIRNEQDEAIVALESLGYKRNEAQRVIKKVDDGNMSCEELIRASLKQLSSRV